ncbi:hypothetical protein [Streptomyces sp. NPDC051452]|uniref:zinc finger domain-containing protein n=1 Tax=Streptomyces sp. NPDC051452 TaxID=3365654 RepID=UPI0037A5A1F2
MTTPEHTPRTVSCPPAPEGCGAAVGQPCMSHGGTRERTDFHRSRTAAWIQARVDRSPAVSLIQRAAVQKRGMHAKHTVRLLEEHGLTAEAALIQRALRDRNGLMSAKQAAQLLLDHAERGEHR